LANPTWISRQGHTELAPIGAGSFYLRRGRGTIHAHPPAREDPHHEHHQRPSIPNDPEPAKLVLSGCTTAGWRHNARRRTQTSSWR